MSPEVGRGRISPKDVCAWEEVGLSVAGMPTAPRLRIKVSGGELALGGSVSSTLLPSLLATYKCRECLCTVLVGGKNTWGCWS